MPAVQTGRHSTLQILRPCSSYYARFNCHAIGARHLVHGTPKFTFHYTTARCACSASDAAGPWDDQEPLLPAAPGTAAGGDVNASVICEDDGVMPSMDEADAIKQPPGRRSAEEHLPVARLDEVTQPFARFCCTGFQKRGNVGSCNPYAAGASSWESWLWQPSYWQPHWSAQGTLVASPPLPGWPGCHEPWQLAAAMSWPAQRSLHPLLAACPWPPAACSGWGTTWS